MICQAILGNLYDGSFVARVAIDEVELHWHECRRRSLRKRSRAGRDVGVLMAAGTVLRHGDVLHADASVTLAVSVRPCALLAIAIESPARAAALAYALGEQHKPMEIRTAEILTPADDAIAALLRRLGFECVEKWDRFAPARSSVTWIAAAEKMLSTSGRPA
jgi:urease accessory protein